MLTRRAFLPAATLLVGAVTRSWGAEKATLRFAFAGPPTSLNLIRGLQPWADQVTKDADGTLNIEIVPGMRLASLGNTYDRLLAGVFDIGYGIQAVTAGKFPKSEVVGLPMLINSATEGSTALWELYQKGLISDEYKDVKVLALYTYPPDVLHFSRPVNSIAALQGMKIGAASAPVADFLAKLGAVPVPVAPTDIYQSASQHLISGFSTPFTGFTQFKLQEVVNYHLDAPIGVQPGYILMNRHSFDGLNEKAKAAIDKNSGRIFSEKMGQALDSVAQTQVAEVKATSGQTFASLEPSQLALWRTAANEMADSWTKSHANGGEVLAALKASLGRRG